MKYLAIVIGLIIVMPVLGQRKKKDDEVVVVAPAYKEGITYSLPRTGIRLYVKATREVFEPGPYAGYAEQLLGIKQVKTRAESKWEVTEIRIEAFSEPDPNQVYKALGEAAFKVNLTSDGIISGINSASINMQPKVVKTNKVLQIPDEIDDFSFDYFTDTPFYTPGDSTNGFSPVRVGEEQKAAEAAQRVLDARMTRYDMVAGMMDEFHPDGEAYKVSLEELSKIEKNYLSLFVGRTTRKKDVFSLDYVPSDPSKKGDVIFRVSDENGVVPASDLSGRPIMIEYAIETGLAEKYAETAKSENPAAGESGIYYRLPGIATVKIVDELNVIASARLTIAQFGAVAPLPEDVVNGGYMVKYHTETGAIKSIYKR